jgi:signal transduction histidine kinase
MHDVVAHSLSVLVTQAEGGRLMAHKNPTVADRVLGTIARTGRDAMESMSSVLQVLDDPAAHDTVEQPQPGLAQLPDLIDDVRRSGLPVRFEEQGGPQRLNGAAELAVYRMVQEGLTNVLKHAGPTAATQVRLVWGDAQLRVSVDNGKGQQPPAAGSGLGLTSMADRLAAIGGSLQVFDSADRFRVEACIPLVEGHLA